jgi:2-oxoglutarate dehydrogenase E2 component (dihydrolipoamide succinyltransferase)
MIDITVPQLNTNDAHVVLVEWCVPDGAEVEAGEVIATLETSKAAEDLEAAERGILLPTAKAGSEIAPGTSIGMLCPDKVTYDRVSAERAPSGEADAAAFTLTDAARALVEQHGISAERLRGLNVRTIRATDLRPLLPPTPGTGPGPSSAASAPKAAEVEELILDQQQLTVAQVVTASHRNIPDASVVVKVGCDELFGALRRYEESEQVTIGAAAVAVAVVAALRARFPRIFAHYHEGRVTLRPGAHIAVTTDVGGGLYLPVVRDADQRTVLDIAGQLMRFRVNAVRRRFEVADLTGSNIAVTLHVDAGVVLAIPVIPPDVAAAVSLCAVQDELVLDPDGGVRRRSYLNLAMTYDHRLINGADAMLFLAELRDSLENQQAVEHILRG